MDYEPRSELYGLQMTFRLCLFFLIFTILILNPCQLVLQNCRLHWRPQQTWSVREGQSLLHSGCRLLRLTGSKSLLTVDILFQAVQVSLPKNKKSLSYGRLVQNTFYRLLQGWILTVSYLYEPIFHLFSGSRWTVTRGRGTLKRHPSIVCESRTPFTYSILKRPTFHLLSQTHS